MTDREKVIEKLKKLNGTSEARTLIAETIILLKEQPEIVRCKDCKYNYNGCCYNKETERINFAISVDNNWFCADGERKYEDA